jgi:sugar lactone lactonase YvrE
MFKGVLEGAARLLAFDAASGQLLHRFALRPTVAPKHSYLNDVRIDENNNFAYLTDSGLGALIAIDLSTGQAIRRLANSQASKSEGSAVVIEGSQWLQNGKKPHVHSDGIAFDPKRDFIYFQALTGKTLYRINAQLLRDFNLPETEVMGAVKPVGKVGVSDGLLLAPNGAVLLTSLTHKAIRRWNLDGSIDTIAHGKLLSWPDSMSFDGRGNLLVTTSLIHLGDTPEEPYRILRIKYQ